MKLLQIASGDFFSTYGGGQVYVKNLVDELIRQGADVVVFSFVDKDITIAQHIYNGIPLYEIGLHAQDSDIEKLLHSISPDIIHAHSRTELFSSLGHHLNIPVIITAHHGGILCPAGTLMNAEDRICQTTLSHRNCMKCCLANIRMGRAWYPFMRLLPEHVYRNCGTILGKLPFLPFITPIGSVANAIQGKIEEWRTICCNATIVIAPSHAIVEAMTRNGMEPEKVRVIPHGIPGEFSVKSLTLSENENTKHERSASLNTKQEQSEQPIRFFFLGRICRVKGLHVLLEAFDDKCFADRAELHIIGGTGNKGERRYMQALQRKYSRANIVWHGKVPSEKVLETIQDFDVMVHPAIYMEIFGLNISESLLMHKPVLATRCGGAEMQIRDGENGWLVEPNNAIALREKMHQIVRDGINLDMNALSSGVISIEEHVKELISLYEETSCAD
ncbi:MAG: glycosyltransferase family 4 protein [Prevotellamassilia sp.]|nr:glycosyltransferase family 4 protein [Prevotellamassilia sp.]